MPDMHSYVLKTIKFTQSENGRMSHCPVHVTVTTNARGSAHDDLEIEISGNNYSGKLEARGAHEAYVLGLALKDVANYLTKKELEEE